MINSYATSNLDKCDEKSGKVAISEDTEESLHISDARKNSRTPSSIVDVKITPISSLKSGPITKAA